MKKTIFLLSGIGIGAGLLYALNRGTNKAAPQNGEGTNGEDRSAPTASNGKSVQGKTAAGISSFDKNLTKSGQGRSGGASSMGQTNADADKHSEPEIDDRGTGQQEASQILKSVRDAAFAESDEKLALALGRPTEEIEAWTNGDGTIDGDVVMKARALAAQRGVEIQ
jgi:hypothetical protein